jgi:1-deoxy-D-xylulose-5-phosphate synthase
MNPVADKAVKILDAEGVKASYIDAKFIKPFDEDMLLSLMTSNKHIVVIEENNYPGSLAQTIKAYAEPVENCARIHAHTLPDRFVTHGSRAQLLAEVKLTSEEVAASILELTR